MVSDVLQKLKVFGEVGGDPSLSMSDAATRKPWLNRALPDDVRFESYKNHMHTVATELRERLERASAPEFNVLEGAPETKAIIAELEWLNTGPSVADFCEEMERRRPPLDRMLDSYHHDPQTGVSAFTIPAGMTDVEAMKALNGYFRKYYPNFNGDAIDGADFEWYEGLPQEYPGHCKARDYSKSREVTIVGVVEGSRECTRSQQEELLSGGSLVLSDPRDQAIAAALHACKHDGAHLFRGLWVRGAVPGFALFTVHNFGILVGRCDGTYGNSRVAASGSPFAGSK